MTVNIIAHPASTPAPAAIDSAAVIFWLFAASDFGVPCSNDSFENAGSPVVLHSPSGSCTLYCLPVWLFSCIVLTKYSVCMFDQLCERLDYSSYDIVHAHGRSYCSEDWFHQVTIGQAYEQALHLSAARSTLKGISYVPGPPLLCTSIH